MKKKIKDLTPDESHELCIKTDCPDCPLSCGGAVCIRPFIKYKNEIDKMMEKEIEVEE